MVTAVLAGLIGTGIGVLAAPMEAPTSSVAFVNIGKCIQEVPSAKKLVDDLQADNDLLQDKIKTRAKELRDKEQDIEARLSPNTPEYTEARKQLALLAHELEWDQKSGLNDIKKRQVRGMAAIYKEIAAEASRVAEEKGFTAVLQAEIDPIQVEDENGALISYTDLRLQMAMRTVVWNSEGVDITKDVIEALK
jgi:Skp family chaperone for outer membrane proteins